MDVVDIDSSLVCHRPAGEMLLLVFVWSSQCSGTIIDSELISISSSPQ